MNPEDWNGTDEYKRGREDMAKEIKKWAKKQKENLVTLNDTATCSPRCHDSGKEMALSELLNFLDV